MNMWKFPRILAPAAALLAGSLVLSADSFVPFIINLHEDGNGSISISGGSFTLLPGVLAPDPSNGGALALTYFFPTSAPFTGTGTILAYEDSSLTSLSDALRLTDAAGDISGTGTADRMIFYSDIDADAALADTGFPSNITSGATVTEVERIGAAAHLPPGEAGFTFVVPDFVTKKGCPDCEIFHVISEVPEPASWILLFTTFGLLGAPRLRKHIRSASSSEPVQAGDSLK